MKRKTLYSIIISLVMFISIISFPMIMLFGERQKIHIENLTEYINAGATVVIFYYKNENDEKAKEIENILDSISRDYLTSLNEIQVFIFKQKGENTEIKIESLKGVSIIKENEISEKTIRENICKLLFYPSVKCLSI